MYNMQEVYLSVQRVITAISDALKVEVVVFDTDAQIFCCTPTYLKRKGRAVHAPSIEEVLSYGSVIVNKPGEMASCIGCRFKDNCPSTIEILSCIKAEGMVMGVVAITSFTKEGHQRISSNPSIYQDIITELSSLIGEIIVNRTGETVLSNTESLVHGIFSVSRNSMLLTDANGIITQCNAIAVKNLNSCNLMTSSLWHIIPENIVKRILSGEEFFENEIHMKNYTARLTTKNILKNDAVIAIVVRLSNEIFLDENDNDYIKRIVGSSPETQKVHSLINKLSDSPTPVLITGETGTGKELFARALHERSHRKRYPFVAINCSSIPENLFESELFGYEEGSFTGAKKGGKIGKIEMAQGGTLFLDELGEMPLFAQPKLLRLLQEYELERVGSTEKISLNIRVIAATNRNLLEMMQEGKFREDLYYRISAINIELPPLRDRTEDTLLIAENYLKKLKQKLDTPLQGFSSSIQEFFKQYDWPGNIRELQNVIEYAANLSENSFMEIEDLPDKLKTDNAKLTSEIKPSKDDMERQVIVDLLEEYGYSLESKNKISQALGISLRTLYRKMEKFGI